MKYAQTHPMRESTHSCILALPRVLPREILERIFRYSPPELAYVSRVFYEISKSPVMRARWLLQRHGAARVLSLAWKWRFFKTARSAKGRLVSCKCKQTTALLGNDPLDNFPPLETEGLQLANTCLVERAQMNLIQLLLEWGASPSSGESMALKMACKYNHLGLCRFLLLHGSDPNAAVSYKRHWLGLRPQLGGNVVKSDADFSVLYQTGPLDRNESKRRSKIEQVGLLLQACQVGNVSLVRLLVSPIRHPPDNGRHTPYLNPSTTDISISPGRRPVYPGRRVNVPPLSRATANDSEITIVETSDLQEAGRDKAYSSAIAPDLLDTSINYCLIQEKLEIAQILSEAGALCSSSVCHSLIQRAGAWRLGFGVRRRLVQLITVSINSLPQDEFDRMSHVVVRGCSEIGSVQGLKAAIDRGADINIMQGLALYTAVYSGNLDIVEYAVQLPSLNIDYFGKKQKLYCLSLIAIEFIAMLLFVSLVAIWALGYAPDGFLHESEEGGGGVSIIELVAMAIPAGLSIVIMYRLVPMHLVVKGIKRISEEKMRRASMV